MKIKLDKPNSFSDEDRVHIKEALLYREMTADELVNAIALFDVPIVIMYLVGDTVFIDHPNAF